jgi:hypothetical protein
MQDDRLTPSERELEAALGGLKPARAILNRDQLMFQAGRASARRQNRLWQAVSVCMAVVLAVSIVYRPTTRAVEPRPVAVANRVEHAGPAPSPTLLTRRVTEQRYFAPVNDYVRMRSEVLRRGIDALPTSHPAPATDEDEPMTGEYLDKLISST